MWKPRWIDRQTILASLPLLAVLVLGPAAGALAQNPLGDSQQILTRGLSEPAEQNSILDGVGFDQKLGSQLPLDLTFYDEQGKPVRLGDSFGKRPVILTLIYYRCPQLCSKVLNGLVRSLRPLSLTVGKDFDVVTVSIDPEDTPYLAQRKKAAYLEEYGRESSAEGWHFLTGDPAEIRQLASTVGFRYTYNPTTKLYAHAAGIVLATPNGRVSRYLYGVDYPPRDLQFALNDSSESKIGSPVVSVLMFCYDYDAAAGRYTLSIVRVLQVCGIATVTTLALAVLFMLRWERRRQAGTPSPGPIEPELPEPVARDSSA